MGAHSAETRLDSSPLLDPILRTLEDSAACLEDRRPAPGTTPGAASRSRAPSPDPFRKRLHLVAGRTGVGGSSSAVELLAAGVSMVDNSVGTIKLRRPKPLDQSHLALS